MARGRDAEGSGRLEGGEDHDVVQLRPQPPRVRGIGENAIVLHPARWRPPGSNPAQGQETEPFEAPYLVSAPFDVQSNRSRFATQ